MANTCIILTMKFDRNVSGRLVPDAQSQEPAYLQIYRRLRELILRGELADGTRLPSSRILAKEIGVARVTILQAYTQLEAEGLVQARRGAGTIVDAGLHGPDFERKISGLAYQPEVTEWGLRALGPDDTTERISTTDHIDIDFGVGRSFAQTFPYAIWRRLLARYLSTDDAMLSRYGSAAGFYPLRQTIADYLARERGVRCTAEQVVIVSGAQQALDILARVLLNPGDEVIVETPGYRDAFALFRLHGLRMRGLPVDDQGLPVDELPRDSSTRLVFVTPAHQFPKGGAMPTTRRLALLNWAVERNALVVEDDYDGDLRYGGRSLAALQGLDQSGSVVYLGTFSKVLFPALRLGYVVLPLSLLDVFVRAKDLVDRGAPTLTQAAVADFIAEGHFERHLRRLRHLYGRRRAVLVEALDAHLSGRLSFSSLAAGLHIMVYLDPAIDETRLVRNAAARGVRVYGGRSFHLEVPAPPSILLGFSGLQDGEIREGVARLAAALNAT